MSICVECARDPDLKRFIQTHGQPASKCGLCGAVDTILAKKDDRKLRDLFRALVRYHYSERQYNTHVGGEDLTELLARENPITDWKPSWDSGSYEEILLEFVEEGYATPSSEIGLFSGHSEEGYPGPPLIAIKSDIHESLRSLRAKLESINYFNLEREIDDLIKPHAAVLERFVESATEMYRARIGFADKKRPLFEPDADWHYVPFSDGQLSCPPPPLAGAGRLNRPGVALLYLASDELTAIHEVRPHPGHIVSTGAFRTRRQVRVADFYRVSIADFAESDESLDQYLLLKTIDGLFCLPVVPEERQKYSFTQFLADAVRRIGFDAVAYRSSVGNGQNVGVFDPNICSYVQGSAKAIRIESLAYTQTVVPSVRKDFDYSAFGSK